MGGIKKRHRRPTTVTPHATTMRCAFTETSDVALPEQPPRPVHPMAMLMPQLLLNCQYHHQLHIVIMHWVDANGVFNVVVGNCVLNGSEGFNHTQTWTPRWPKTAVTRHLVVGQSLDLSLCAWGCTWLQYPWKLWIGREPWPWCGLDSVCIETDSVYYQNSIRNIAQHCTTFLTALPDRITVILSAYSSI